MGMTESIASVRAHGKCTILLVDDDVELCKLIAEYLGKQGYTVQFAYDGRNGLARALNEHFDFLILDGMLPIVDGLEVLRQLRKFSSIPVIMLTARTQERDHSVPANCWLASARYCAAAEMEIALKWNCSRPGHWN
jgi:CheY-like chemotaxis protein